MANIVEQQVARLTAIEDELAAMVPGSGNPGSAPNVKSGGGLDTIDHATYRKNLLEEKKLILDFLDKQGIAIDSNGNAVSSIGINSTPAYPI